LCPLVIANTAFAANDVYTNKDLSLAQESAQNYIEEMALINPELSQWEKAKAVSPQVYYNLEGEINSYMFEVVSERGIAGYVFIGSSLYCYDMLESGTTAPPTITNPEMVQKAVEALGLKIDDADIGTPDKFIYTGVDGHYVLYTIKDLKVAVNLVSGKAVLTSELNMTMTSPENYMAGKEETRTSEPKATRSTGYNYLYAYYWTGSGRGWCGPCSGVSIGQYYRNFMGYDDLYSHEAMYDDLYDEMNTLNGATFPTEYGPGFLAMTENCGYSNFSIANDWTVTHADYWTITSGIDSGWPTALEITSDWHWGVIKGYSYNTDNDYYYIMCTDSATHESAQMLNWDALGSDL